MGPLINETTRWCPVCGGRGVSIVWGYPTDETMRRAEAGDVVLGGCVVTTEVTPSHECTECPTEFVARNMLYRRVFGDREVYGIGVWPHGRRRVRIEVADEGSIVLVEGKGPMLLNEHDFTAVMNELFADWWPWDVQAWVTKRGFPATVLPTETGWSLNVGEGGPFVELLLFKTWWRGLGRGAVNKAIERLTCEASSPIWIPEAL